jgi:5'-3' exonuclease/DNA polymerase I-like protein with 3'-5' exonuclease and polymerase domains
MADHETYLLIDASGVYLHAFHSGKDPEAPKDPNSKKVINPPAHVLDRMLDLYPYLEETPPRRMIAVWDGGNAYRESLFPGYKAKRKAERATQSDALKEGTAAAKEAVERLYAAIGVTQVKVAGVEADDVIAYLASKLPNSVIISRDHDLAQILHDVPGTRAVIGGTMIEGECDGVPVSLVRLRKSICGDSTDEYPGIVGSGDKFFQGLLKDFGEDGLLDLESILSSQSWRDLKALAEDDPRFAKLYEDREHWYVQYLLASTHPELCEGVRNRKVVKLEWSRRVPSHQDLLALEHDVKLPGLHERMLRWLPAQVLAEADGAGQKALGHVMNHLEDGPIVSMDYESYDTLEHPAFKEARKRSGSDYVDVLSQEITGMSMCYGDNYQRVVYVPVRHADTLNRSPNDLVALMGAVLARRPMVVQNAAFEHTVTWNTLGIQLPSLYDTRIMAHYVDEEGDNSLKAMSKRYLGYEQATYEETLEKYGVEDMSQLSGEQVLSYGCDDALVTAHLFDLFWLICTIEGTWPFIRDREFDFVQEVDRGFIAGVTGDMRVIARLRAKAELEFEEAHETLDRLLREHCRYESQERATPLFKDLGAFLQSKLQADGCSRETVQEKLNALWAKCVRSTRYPWVDDEVVEAARNAASERGKFVPSAKKLNELAMKLGAVHEIEKVSRKALMAWLVKMQGELEDIPDGAREEFVHLSEYMGVIAEAAHEIRARSGDQYEKLKAFWIEHMGKGQAEGRGEEEDDGEPDGARINLGSPPQVQRLLYCLLGLTIRIRSKNSRTSQRAKLGYEGAPATNDLALTYALVDDAEPGSWQYECLLCIKKARKASTSLSLFLRPMPLWVHPLDGNVHPQIKNCGTVTGRPSGTSPNFLQLTKKDGGHLRGSVLPYGDSRVQSPEEAA